MTLMQAFDLIQKAVNKPGIPAWEMAARMEYLYRLAFDAMEKHGKFTPFTPETAPMYEALSALDERLMKAIENLPEELVLVDTLGVKVRLVKIGTHIEVQTEGCSAPPQSDRTYMLMGSYVSVENVLRNILRPLVRENA